MSLLIILLAGAIIGWLASLVMKTDAEQGWLADILVGIIGAALGKLLLSDILGIGGAASAGSLSLAGIAWGVVGAVILIGLIKVLRRSTTL